MQTVQQIKADAINHFISMIIGARESGFIGTSVLTLAELHQLARHHVNDNYAVPLPRIEEQWGEQVAELCRSQTLEPREMRFPELKDDTAINSDCGLTVSNPCDFPNLDANNLEAVTIFSEEPSPLLRSSRCLEQPDQCSQKE